MHRLLVVGVSLLVFLGAVAINRFTRLPAVAILTIVTAAWVSFDSRRIELRRYRAGEAAHPVLLFWVTAKAWPIWFPWYLLVRRRILAGTLQRGPAFHPDDFLF